LSDNKKWFKVWTSLLTDPEFDDISNQSIGAWVRLGALIAQHGENGMITISKQQLLKRANLNESDLNLIIPSLSNINVDIQTSDNGTCFVSFKQWAKYQTDWNSYARLKKFRKSQMITKHETVQDKNKIKTKTKIIEEKKIIKTPPKLSDEQWMQTIKENPAYNGIDIQKEQGKCEAWCLTNSKQMSRRRLLNWLNRTEKPMQTKFRSTCVFVGHNDKPYYFDCPGCEKAKKGEK